MPNLNPEAAFESLKGQVAATIKAQFPFEGAVRRLELVDIVFEEKSGSPADPHHIDNLDEQLKARTTGMTWGVPVRGRLRLVNKASGHVIEEASVTLAKLPKLTRRYSYLIDGQERQHDSVFRSKARAYHRITSSGDIQARWNLARGHGFDLTYDPVKGRMIMKIGDSNIPLYSVLHVLGVGDASMERQWGPAIFRDNVKAAKPGDVDKIYSALRLRMADRTPGSPDQRMEKIREYFAQETEVLPDAMKAAFGKEYTTVNGENLLLSSARLLDIQKGRSKEDPPAHELPDDRQALSAKYLATTEDFVIEALRHHEAGLRKQVQDRIDKPEYGITDILSPNTYGRVVLAPFQHAQRPEQTNPLQLLSGYMRTTIRGKEFGGVGGEKVNLDVEKELNPSHLGFIDPIQTPEGEDTGIALNLPLGISLTRAATRPGSKSRASPGQEIRTKVYDTRAKQMVLATPAELEHEVVAYPDQVRWAGGHPEPVAAEVVCYDEQRKTSKRPWSKVRYVLPSAKALLSFSANLIPFLQNNNGNRAMMAAKQQEQALALVRREAPLVQVKTDGAGTFEHVVGSFVTHTAPSAGVVKRIEPGAIHLQTAEGLVRVPMYNHFPLNGGKNSLHSIPTVKVGQTVEKGGLLADSNYTKDGALALGSNLRVAYVPWKGLTFEDGIVVSESAAKRMSSDHMHALEVTVYASMIGATAGAMARWRDYATPERSTSEHISKLDERGIVREGSVVHSGDVLVAILSPKQTSESDQAAGLIHKTLARSFRDASLMWDHDYSGKVVRVIVSEAMNRKHVTVHIATEQPLVVGDKLSGRHGNKGIISRIVQDHEMPHTADGVPADLLLNPAGVPSRMNVGQVLETAASKIAEKTGKPYVVENFVPGVDYSAKVTADLKKHGLTDTEEMFDPVTKRSIGQIMVGKQYMLKLHHQVEKKATARSMESGYTHTGEAPKGSGIPGGGQKMDMLTTYAMLAHGANHNLREAYTFKSDGDQNAAWAAVITGNPLPPPQPTRGMGHFQNYLRALGVNVEKRKDDYHLSPLTDLHLLGDAKRGIRGISNGEIKLPEKLSVARGARTVEEHGGLFDPRVTGGLQGKFWSHVELAERMPSPLFEPAIQTLTGLTKKQFDTMVGEKGLVDGKSGFHVIVERLGAINVDDALKKAQAEVGKSSRATLNRAMKKVRYLEALKATGMTPLEAYTNKYLPVLPPSVRRVSVGLDGTQVVDDRNPLYLGVGHANGILKEAKPSTPREDMQKARASLYSSIRSLKMTGMTTSPGAGKPRHMQGLMELLSGKTEDHGAPKESFFQEGVLARRQDLSGRSTIVPEPGLGLDQVGVPRQIAMEMYKPFVVRELVRGGKTPIEALKWAKEKKDHPQVMDALERAVAERPVFLKRDPSLHKFSIMAFHPKIVEGSAIKIHPLVTGGFNADFDGDCFYGQVLIDADEGVSYHESMPHYLRVPGQKVLHIKDFPRVESTRVEKESGVIEYDVPGGVRVPACFTDPQGMPRIESFEVSKFSEHPECEEWTVRTRAGREMVVSEDHSLALLDPETLEVVKRPPRDSRGLCLPTMWRSEEGGVPTYDLRAYRGPMSNDLVDSISVDREIAWMIGVTIGDGWVTQKNESSFTTSLSFGDEGADVAMAWERVVGGVADGAIGYTELPHEFEGKAYTSHRITLSNTGFARWLKSLIGTGAANKHLPEGFLHWDLEARRGLFCGLIDTDGSINQAKSGRFSCSFTTTSARLAEEVRLLGLTLGLISTFTEFENRERPAFILTFSVRQVQEAAWLRLVSERKQTALALLQTGPERETGHTDFVPLPTRVREELVVLLRAAGATRRAPNKNKAAFSLYVTLSKNNPTLSRESFHLLWKVLGPELEYSAYLCKWISICNAPVGWDVVEEAVFDGNYRTMYDITVPGAWTFATADGAIVWDTMALYVPVSAEAVEEAHKMLPSRNLFSPTHFGLLPVPGQDSLLGIFQSTKWGAEVPVPEGTTAERAVQMMHDGKLKPTDVILVDGKKTTPGRLALAGMLPAEMRGNEKLLHDSTFRLNKDGVETMLSRVAREHDKGFAQTVDGWKDLGNHLSYLNGSSFSIRDFHDGVDMRDRILKPYEEKEKELHATPMSSRKRDQEIVKLYQGAQAELKRVGKAKYDAGGNRVWEWAESGARGNWNQFAQLTLAPVLVEDFARRTVPVPITKSFGEGLSVSEYWASMHGARKGTLDRAQGTREPGAVQKDIVNTTMGIQVTAADCGATDGKKMPVGHNDLVGRFLAHAVKLGTVDVAAGELITPALVSQARNAGVHELVVRSPLFCRMGKGVCAKCYGHNERGGLHPVGTNLGVIAGQALSEPITQLAMKCSEGVVTDSAGTAWAMEDYFAAHGVDAPTGDEVRTKTLAGAMLADGDDDVHALALQTHMPDAEMVFIKTRSGHALAVQANHPLWVYEKNGKESVKPAGELIPGVDCLRVDRAAALVPGDQRCPLHPYVVGFFLAEGSTRYGNGTPRYDNVAVASVFSQHDTPQKAKLEHALSAVPGIRTVSAHEKCVEVYDPVFARELADVVRGRTSYVKRLQPGFNRWPDSDLIKLLGGWIDGDGTVFVKSGVMVAKIYTSSFVALQQLEIICAKLGIRCSSGYVSRPDERVQVESRHANFFAELRFRETSGNVWQHSLRMQAKGPLLFAKHRFIDNDLDSVKKVQVMPKWITPVWDVKTSSQGFTCGMLRNHNTFHTGGVSSAGQSSAVDSFKRVKQLFMVPDKLPDKAALATTTGVVGKISPDPRGGVTIDIDGKPHRVVTGHVLEHIKAGVTVQRGDPLSTGPLDPHELLEHTKSIGRTRNYITDEATAAYQGTVRQRNVEMVVRGMTNLTEVHNAPHGSPWHQGDLAPLSAVEEHNANAAMEGHAVIEHTPTLRAMTLVPLSGTEDWMARLNYQRLKDTYTEGAAQGWQSNIHDHPIPGLAHGAEFGLRPPTARTPPPAAPPVRAEP